VSFVVCVVKRSGNSVGAIPTRRLVVAAGSNPECRWR
jgi:hypothetical protein